MPIENWKISIFYGFWIIIDHQIQFWIEVWKREVHVLLLIVHLKIIIHLFLFHTCSAWYILSVCIFSEHLLAVPTFYLFRIRYESQVVFQWIFLVSVMVSEINLIAAKLWQEEILVEMWHTYYTVPITTHYFQKKHWLEFPYCLLNVN